MPPLTRCTEILQPIRLKASSLKSVDRMHHYLCKETRKQQTSSNIRGWPADKGLHPRKTCSRANLLALEKSNFDCEAINVGTGKPLLMTQIATALSKAWERR